MVVYQTVTRQYRVTLQWLSVQLRLRVAETNGRLHVRHAVKRAPGAWTHLTVRADFLKRARYERQRMVARATKFGGPLDRAGPIWTIYGLALGPTETEHP